MALHCRIVRATLLLDGEAPGPLQKEGGQHCPPAAQLVPSCHRGHMCLHAGSCVGWKEGRSGLQASGLHQHRARAPAHMSPSHLYPAPGPCMPHLSYLMSPGAGARPRLTPPQNPVTPVTLGWPSCGQCQPVLRGRGHLQATAPPPPTFLLPPLASSASSLSPLSCPLPATWAWHAFPTLWLLQDHPRMAAQ